MRNSEKLILLLAILAVLTPGLCGKEAHQSKPAITITITTVPPKAAGGADELAVIAGTVQGAPKSSRRVIFAHGDVWYAQPYVSSRFTRLIDGEFHTETHLGTQYPVLVVRSSYRPPATTVELPDRGGDILQLKVVPGR